jgi:hypothetical protein
MRALRSASYESSPAIASGAMLHAEKTSVFVPASGAP